MNRKSLIISKDGAERMTLALVMTLAHERGLGPEDPAEVRWQAQEQQWSISWPNPAEEQIG
jgi:hypothetical protein